MTQYQVPLVLNSPSHVVKHTTKQRKVLIQVLFFVRKLKLTHHTYLLKREKKFIILSKSQNLKKINKNKNTSFNSQVLFTWPRTQPSKGREGGGIFPYPNTKIRWKKRKETYHIIWKGFTTISLHNHIRFWSYLNISLPYTLHVILLCYIIL